ncbi:O-methyltransferase (plasmid) [Mycolicibacterium arabiense]|uniref:O-methyltransferase n=2 Tax=Mycolicibacterium arabiense TaxID=1286181 RepID=A0A7I7RQ14_9MYCO|nr:O-methyltransferase [Mycolicibacterium arabiense]
MNIDPSMTHRLLRAAALGFVVFNPETSRFARTAMLDVLDGESPLSLKHYAQTAGSEVSWMPGMRMTDTVRAGRDHTQDVLGCSPFEFFAEDDSAARVFSLAMTEISTPVIAEAVLAIEPDGARTVVDVGGADGAFVAHLLKMHNQLSGVVLDLPQAMSGVESESRRRSLQDRITGVAGDFFREIPSADIYLLKFILHDWDDESCRQILTNVHTSMGPRARLFVVDMTTDDGSVEAAMMDMGMMAAFTGQERNTDHLRSLLASAGLRTVRTSRLHQPYIVIEAMPLDVEP